MTNTKKMKIMIRATNWVGDAIMALPALRAVRERHPDAQIAIVARPYVADIYRDQQSAMSSSPTIPTASIAAGAAAKNSSTNSATANSMSPSSSKNAFDAAWLAWRAQIPQRIGYARDARSLLLTKAIPVPKPGEIPPHEKFYYLDYSAASAGSINSPTNHTSPFASPMPPVSAQRKLSSKPVRAPTPRASPSVPAHRTAPPMLAP